MISTSSSNWLDRLRSSRGFPTGEEPDLDRFISLSSSSGSTESAAHVMREKTPQWTPPPGEFAAVLSDLFNMGGDQSSRSYSKKKASRKQPNPRFFCVDNDLPTSSDDLRRDRCDNGGFLSSGDNSLHEKRVINDNGNDNVNVRVDVDVEERDVGVDDNVDLKGFSRSEVTVIDTSFDEWKSDKWVFRKNDEWKIKEKKSRFKSRVCGGGGGSKKRKLLDCNLGVNNNNNNNNNNNKVDDDQLMKKKQKEEEQTNKKQPQIDETRVPAQKREAFLGKVRQKRFPCPRPPDKVRKEASPVILIKSIPLNDTSTNVATIKPGKSSLKKRPKQMKIN